MADYKCNLLILGFPKCGTSALHMYLNQHPEICMSSPKEPHFFSIPEKRKGGSLVHNSLFEGARGSEVYYGESSQTYCCLRDTLEDVSASLSGSKIILILRHPVDRVLSHYKWAYAQMAERRPLLVAYKEEQIHGFDPVVNNFKNRYLMYGQASRYSEYVPLIQEFFGRENVFIKSYDDYKNDNISVVREIVEWLGLCDYDGYSALTDNVTREMRPLRVSRGFWGSGRWAPSVVRNVVKSFLGKEKTRSFLSKKLKPVEIDESDRAYIEDDLRKEVEYYNNLFSSRVS